MKSIDYLVLTQLMIDDVAKQNEMLLKNTLGGGALTVAGIRIWSDRVGISSGVGRDFHDDYSDWFEAHDIDLQGLIVKHKKTTHAMVNYSDADEREVTPYADAGSLDLMQLFPKEIPKSYRSMKGIYIFKDLEKEFWQEMLEYLKDSNILSIWEIRDTVTNQNHVTEIIKTLKNIDLFSLNLAEGKSMTGKDDPIEIIEEISKWGAKGVIFRMGKDGALVSDIDNIWHIPAVETKIVDVTGCGNASTGGFLVGWKKSNGNPVIAGCYASVSASFIAEQYGLPNRIDNELEREALSRLKKLQKRIKKVK